MTDAQFEGLTTARFALNYRGTRHGASLGYWVVEELTEALAVRLARDWLHPREQARFDRLPLARRRSSFLLGRVLTKTLLRDFGIQDDPRRSWIGSGVFGQPVLHHGESGLRVTLSHTAGRICAVVSETGVPFGIDVEQILASRLPSLRQALADDLGRFSASRGPLSEAGFAVALWTQKESVGKATHIGLTAPMATYDLARLDWPTPDRAYAEFANLGQFACETCCCADFAVSLAFPRLGVLDRHLDQLLPAAAVRSAALV